MATSELVFLHPSTVPSDYVKEGADWLCVFNPRVQRVMDVKLHARISCKKYVNPPEIASMYESLHHLSQGGWKCTLRPDRISGCLWL